MKKNNTFKVLGLAVAMLFCGQSIKAQTALETSIFLNGVAPAGQLNDNATLDNGLLGKDQIGTAAGLGFGGGIRAGLPFDIGMGYVVPFVSVPNYWNIPLMIGVQYRYPLADMGMEYLTPYGEFGLGYDFFMISGEGNKTHQYNTYKVKGAMAWQLGLGAFLGNHVSLGIHYYGLGTHTVKYGKCDPVDMLAAHPENKLRTIGEWALRFGFHF